MADILPGAIDDSCHCDPRLNSHGLIVLGIAVLAAGLACGGTDSQSQPLLNAPRSNPQRPADPGAATAGSHVFVIVLENREYGEVIGNPAAPYLNRLARRRLVATHYYAVSHPSLPNYLAMIGGSTFGIRSDCTACHATGANLATQLSSAGIGWRAYMEAMPSRCFGGAYFANYAKKHNPFSYFPAITSNPSLCDRVVPGRELGRDLGRGSLAAFTWITPDLCNDGHDCSIGVSDRHLARLVPALLRHLGTDGFLLVTFDEGSTSAGCCGGAHGGRVATVIAGPDVRRRARLAKDYTHFSLLRTLEDHFGVAHLRKAADARPLREAFTAAG
jgi:hypothetical protein